MDVQMAEAMDYERNADPDGEYRRMAAEETRMCAGAADLEPELTAEELAELAADNATWLARFPESDGIPF